MNLTPGELTTLIGAVAALVGASSWLGKVVFRGPELRKMVAEADKAVAEAGGAKAVAAASTFGEWGKIFDALRSEVGRLTERLSAVEREEDENRAKERKCQAALEEAAEQARKLQVALTVALAEAAASRFKVAPGSPFARVLDASGGAFMLAGRDHVIIWVSTAWRSVLGYAPEQMIGKPWTTFLSKISLENTMRESAAQLRRPTEAFRNTYLSCAGEEVPLVWWASPYQGSNATFAVALPGDYLPEADPDAPVVVAA